MSLPKTCDHGYIFSSATYAAMDGCKLPFPEEGHTLISDEKLRTYEEIARELTDSWHTKHGPGRLVVRQFPELSQGSFVFNEDNNMALWEARWGSGPATEALCLAPHAMRDLVREVKMLRKRLANAEEEVKLFGKCLADVMVEAEEES